MIIAILSVVFGVLLLMSSIFMFCRSLDNRIEGASKEMVHVEIAISILVFTASLIFMLYCGLWGIARIIIEYVKT